MILYHHISVEEHEHLYGPGKRVVIWLQGCSLRCEGCINQHMWDFSSGQIISPSDLIKMVVPADIEGITFLGGEPLDQAAPLEDVVKSIRSIRKTIVLFTGYNYKELITSSQKKIWKFSDLVIAGRFVQSKRSIYLQFRGSTNQRVYVHKGNYEKYRVKDGMTMSVIDIGVDGNVDLKGFDSENIVPANITIIQEDR